MLGRHPYWLTLTPVAGLGNIHRLEDLRVFGQYLHISTATNYQRREILADKQVAALNNAVVVLRTIL